ncbi:MAG: hypothetical protein ACYC35_09460 [Pirellulales bacterium]
MKALARSAGGRLASLAWVALRSFAGTLCVVTLAGIVLAGLSYYFLREYHWMYGLLAVALALVEAVTLGVFLGAKRAVVLAVAHGLGAMRLGRASVRLVFERMPGLAGADAPGQDGGRIARGLQRLPLAQAEELLTGAVRGVTGDATQGGWLRRKIHARLLETVRKYTLARFREEGVKQGGIDLPKVQEELEDTVDDVLVRKIRGGLRLWTVLVMLGLPVVVALQTWLIVLLARSRG